jgi:hypothetical protein
VLPEDLIAMLETLDRGTLRGLRDRAMLLLCRRAAPLEVVGLDCGATRPRTSGWIEILDKGMLLRLRGKTGWREVEVGRGSSDATCPVVALETWLKLARIAHGPCSGASPARARLSAPIGSTTRRSPASSSAPRWPPACAAICRRPTRQDVCRPLAAAWPPRPRSTNAMCSSSATLAPR